MSDATRVPWGSIIIGALIGAGGAALVLLPSSAHASTSNPTAPVKPKSEDFPPTMAGMEDYWKAADAWRAYEEEEAKRAQLARNKPIVQKIKRAVASFAKRPLEDEEADYKPFVEYAPRSWDTDPTRRTDLYWRLASGPSLTMKVVANMETGEFSFTELRIIYVGVTIPAALRKRLDSVLAPKKITFHRPTKAWGFDTTYDGYKDEASMKRIAKALLG